MRTYGHIAIYAARLLKSNEASDPRDAWKQATKQLFKPGVTSASKSCPRTTFISLCEEGLVDGIAGTSQSMPSVNKEYALRALTALKAQPGLAQDMKSLWHIARDGKPIRHNGQLDVVVGLFTEHMLSIKS